MGFRRDMIVLCAALLASSLYCSESAPSPAPGRSAAAPAPATVPLPQNAAQCTSLPNGGSDNVTADGTLIVQSVTAANGAKTYRVDPWIQPPCANKSGEVICNCNNTVTGQQNGNFLSYPVINATCRDSINFTMRAVQTGLRVHGVYLLQSAFVDPKSPKGYWCPSACTDVEVRNHSTPVSAGRCRAYNIRGFTQPDGSFFPIIPDLECSGYYQLDQGYLQVLSYARDGNCSASNVSVTHDTCAAGATVPVSLAALADGLGFLGNKSTIVFACPNIAGNQPGNATAGSHCEDGMALVVNVDCTPSVFRGGSARAPTPAGAGTAGGTGLAPESDTFGTNKGAGTPSPTPSPRARGGSNGGDGEEDSNPPAAAPSGRLG